MVTSPASLPLSSAPPSSASTLPEGSSVLTCAGDVRDAARVEASVAEAVARLGGLDGLVTSAGIVGVTPSFAVTPEAFRDHLEVNVTGSWLYAQAVGRHMAEQGAGRIVMIGSVYGIGGAPQRAAYCASKGGLDGLTRVLANEWGRRGIRVNGVHPVVTLTPMAVKAWSDPAKSGPMLARMMASRCIHTPLS